MRKENRIPAILFVVLFLFSCTAVSYGQRLYGDYGKPILSTSSIAQTMGPIVQAGGQYAILTQYDQSNDYFVQGELHEARFAENGELIGTIAYNRDVYQENIYSWRMDDTGGRYLLAGDERNEIMYVYKVDEDGELLWSYQFDYENLSLDYCGLEILPNAVLVIANTNSVNSLMAVLDQTTGEEIETLINSFGYIRHFDTRYIMDDEVYIAIVGDGANNACYALYHYDEENGLEQLCEEGIEDARKAVIKILSNKLFIAYEVFNSYQMIELNSFDGEYIDGASLPDNYWIPEGGCAENRFYATGYDYAMGNTRLLCYTYSGIEFDYEYTRVICHAEDFTVMYPRYDNSLLGVGEDSLYYFDYEGHVNWVSRFPNRMLGGAIGQETNSGFWTYADRLDSRAVWSLNTGDVDTTAEPVFGLHSNSLYGLSSMGPVADAQLWVQWEEQRWDYPDWAPPSFYGIHLLNNDGEWSESTTRIEVLRTEENGAFRILSGIGSDVWLSSGKGLQRYDSSGEPQLNETLVYPFPESERFCFRDAMFDLPEPPYPVLFFQGDESLEEHRRLAFVDANGELDGDIIEPVPIPTELSLPPDVDIVKKCIDNTVLFAFRDSLNMEHRFFWGIDRDTREPVSYEHDNPGIMLDVTLDDTVARSVVYYDSTITLCSYDRFSGETQQAIPLVEYVNEHRELRYMCLVNALIGPDAYAAFQDDDVYLVYRIAGHTDWKIRAFDMAGVPGPQLVSFAEGDSIVSMLPTGHGGLWVCGSNRAYLFNADLNPVEGYGLEGAGYVADLSVGFGDNRFFYVDSNGDLVINIRKQSYNLVQKMDSNGSQGVGRDDETSLVPATFSLAAPWPNPFNSTTRIQYSLPAAGNVRVAVFDVLGREVCTLWNGGANAGVHEVTWDGNNKAGQPLASGVYFIRGQWEGQVQVQKMTLVK